MLHGRVDVAVGVILQMVPDGRPTRILEGHLALYLSRIEQEGDHGALGDVFGNVLLCVVGAHLLLVDVLFEDVAQHIRVDLVVLAQWALIQMPLVAVEIGEDAREGFVRDLDVRAALLDRVLLEEPAIQMGAAWYAR